MNNKRLPAATLALLLSLSFVKAQSWELGLFLGTSFYDGEIAPLTQMDYLKTIRPAGGLYVRGQWMDRLALRLQISQAQIMGDDQIAGRTRNLSFTSPLTEAALIGEINIFRFSPGNKQHRWTPYLYGGPAVFRFDPRTQLQGETVRLQPVGTEGQGLPGYDKKYTLTQLSLVGGGGIKIAFGTRWSLGMELGARKTFTDHLDDMGSPKYANLKELSEGNGLLAVQLAHRAWEIRGDGDPTVTYPEGQHRAGPAKDWYYLGGITLGYSFGGNRGGWHGGKKSRFGCPSNF